MSSAALCFHYYNKPKHSQPQHIISSSFTCSQNLLSRETNRKRKKMYKTKLQELCQQKQWGLPKYTCMKDGQDHHPRFNASVFVNGNSFDSHIDCRSSKEAHNSAAMVAFLHLTCPSPPPPCSDEQSQYKLRLHKYAQQQKLDFPIYSSCKSEGSCSDASPFKATVAVGGCVFESPDQECFSSFKEAEDAAAEASCLALSLESFQQNEYGHYKNLLQELTQREGFSMPVYTTTNSGEPHRPVFLSTVDVDGEIFCGKGAKSKKQAELEAARVACIALTERASAKIFQLASHNLKQQSSQEHEHEVLPHPAPAFGEPAKENKGSAKTGTINGGERSYLLCNKVRVYPMFPEQAFPEGITVLPISDDRWVAISLEFPNEQSN